jgi:ATP-dependent RNA helicase RhlE
VPAVPDDYIHRVGRTARAEATGDAFTFVAPQEEPELGRIERAIGRRLPRVTVPDFDYGARPEPPRAARTEARRGSPRSGDRRGSPGGRGRRRPRRSR